MPDKAHSVFPDETIDVRIRSAYGNNERGKRGFDIDAEALQTLGPEAASPYADIIDLSRPKSLRPAMPMRDRAAQFSPFDALTGYEDAISNVVEETQAHINELDKGIPFELEELCVELFGR